MATPSLAMPSHVRLVEVGPRDGLQNEKTIITTADKIALIDRLSATGLQSIEATSFVSPKWVPQLADAADVFAGIDRRPGVSYPVLVPNLQGYERARAAGAEEVAVFTAASEAFNRKNINASIDESIARIESVMAEARTDGVPVRVARQLHRLGCYEISLGDTIGVGTPRQARAMLEAVAGEVPLGALAVHF